jgi:hypothetical protein
MLLVQVTLHYHTFFLQGCVTNPLVAMQHHAFFYKAVAPSRLYCFVATCEITTLAHSRNSYVMQFLLVQFKFPNL